MNTSRLFSFASFCLTMIAAMIIGWQVASCQVVWGQVVSGQVVSGQVGADAEPPAVKPAAVKKKTPVYDSPLLKPKQMLPPGQLFEHHRLTKPAEKVKQQPPVQQAVQPLPANQQPLPANRPRRSFLGPPFASPQASQHIGTSQLPRGNLSRASVYQLGSMGNYVHLSPAMRLHLDRSSAAASPMPSTRLPSAATVPGQGADNYYPGVSQLPAQKPFSNLERPETGLQRYWPLLLEGRQDPNSGLIIWRLP